MKTLPLLLIAAVLAACNVDSDKEKADAERKKKLENMYKVPEKGDRSKNKGY